MSAAGSGIFHVGRAIYFILLCGISGRESTSHPAYFVAHIDLSLSITDLLTFLHIKVRRLHLNRTARGFLKCCINNAFTVYVHRIFLRTISRYAFIVMQNFWNVITIVPAYLIAHSDLSLSITDQLKFFYLTVEQVTLDRTRWVFRQSSVCWRCRTGSLLLI